MKAGFEIVENFITPNQLKNIGDEIDAKKLGERSIRNAEKHFDTVRRLAESAEIISKAQKYLKKQPALVRAILFDKSERNNWLVSWHQDRTVAVSKKFEMPGWGPWSVKDQVLHVQPPVEVLEEMVSLRIHLDDTNIENGCLKVIPASHTKGILNRTDIDWFLQRYSPVICEAKAGSVLVMRPHLLHSSSKATKPNRRRVLHLEYNSYQLPRDISWA